MKKIKNRSYQVARKCTSNSF